MLLCELRLRRGGAVCQSFAGSSDSGLVHPLLLMVLADGPWRRHVSESTIDANIAHSLHSLRYLLDHSPRPRYVTIFCLLLFLVGGGACVEPGWSSWSLCPTAYLILRTKAPASTSRLFLVGVSISHT